MTDEQWLLLMERLDRIEANTTKPEKHKKDPKPIETPEQWLARLRAEFKEMANWDFDSQIAKCKEHYRVKRKQCRRDTIEDWLLRTRKWRLENGVPEETPAKKHGGLVL